MNALFYALTERCFRGTLANFFKSKKCIIFNGDYRTGFKKSKFEMTLIRQSPFNMNFLKSFCILFFSIDDSILTKLERKMKQGNAKRSQSIRRIMP